MNGQTVLLYGQSLLLSGVAADLAEVPGLQVERARQWADADRVLVERMPDVLIFDLTEIRESHVLPLLLKDPHPVMVGLDTEHNQAVLLTGRAARSLTLDQIRHIAAGERRGWGEEDAGSEVNRVRPIADDGQSEALPGGAGPSAPAANQQPVRSFRLQGAGRETGASRAEKERAKEVS